jgi:hypothetical protein
MPTRLTTMSEPRMAAATEPGWRTLAWTAWILADPADRLQVERQFRPAHGDPDAVIAPRQRPHYMPPQKAPIRRTP